MGGPGHLEGVGKGGLWIVVPRWDGSDGFQHYRDRDPIWIKNYRTLLSSDEYLTLSFHIRGVLHGLWLAYAASNRQLRDSTLTLTRRIGQRVTTRDLLALNHAGFIEFSASRPLAPVYQAASLDKEKEKKKTRAHALEQKPFRCDVPSCAISFGTAEKLADHLANVHGRGHLEVVVA